MNNEVQLYGISEQFNPKPKSIYICRNIVEATEVKQMIQKTIQFEDGEEMFESLFEAGFEGEKTQFINEIQKGELLLKGDLKPEIIVNHRTNTVMVI